MATFFNWMTWLKDVLLLIFPCVYLLQLITVYTAFKWINPFFAGLKGVFIILFFSSFAYFFNVASPDDEMPFDHIKLMSYNVHNFDADLWWLQKEKKTNYYQLFKEENADIICFQEFYSLTNKEGYNYIDSLRLLFGYNDYYFHVMEQDEGQQYHGISIFSKYPIIHSGKLDYYPATKNGTVYADILIKGDTIRMYNSHFESFRLSEDVKVKINSFDLSVDTWRSLFSRMKESNQRRQEQIDAVVTDMKHCKHKVIATGDYNQLPHSYSYMNIMDAHPLKDVFLEKGYGMVNTFITWLPWLRIDHVLVDETINVHRYERRKVKYSDHYPIISYLSL